MKAENPYLKWVEDTLKENRLGREAKWREAVAVGNIGFVDEAK